MVITRIDNSKGVQQPEGGQYNKYNPKTITLIALTIVIVISGFLLLNTNSFNRNIKLLKSDTDFLKIYAAHRLGSIGHTGAVPPLLDTLKDDNVKVKQAAAEALGELGDLSAIAPLKIAINDVILDDFIDTDDEKLIKIAMISIIKILSQNYNIPSNTLSFDLDSFYYIEDSLRDIERYLRRGNLDSREEKEKFAKIINESIFDTLEDKNPNTRLIALFLASEFDELSNIDPIVKLLDDKEDNIRLLAAIILGDAGGDRVFDIFIEFIDDKDIQVRKKVISRLGRMKNTRVVDVLLEKLDDDNVDIRVVVVKALERQGSKRVTKALIEVLNDPNIGVRVAAINALWELGEQEKALEAAGELHNDGDFSYRRGFGNRLEYEIEHELKMKRARDNFLDETNIASIELYGTWLKDWILQGGVIGTNSRGRGIGTIYVISDGAVVLPLYGASSVTLIAPKGTSFTIENLGHGGIYFWNEDGHAVHNGNASPIVSKSVETYLRSLNNYKVNKALDYYK